MGQCNTCNTKTSRDAGDKLDYSNPGSRQKPQRNSGQTDRESTSSTNTYNRHDKRYKRQGSDVSSSYGGSEGSVTLQDFQKIKVVGRGAYGKVYLVKHAYTDKIFAMKEVKKELVIKTD